MEEDPSALPVPDGYRYMENAIFSPMPQKNLHKGVEFSKPSHYTVCEKRFLPMQGIQGGVDLGI
jgi:hypothetical protein